MSTATAVPGAAVPGLAVPATAYLAPPPAVQVYCAPWSVPGLAVPGAAMPASAASLSLAGAALSASCVLRATAPSHADDLWVIYLALKEVAIRMRQNWHMMRQAGGTDGTSGFLFGSFYEADQAADQAYENWRAAQGEAFPGARG